MQIIPAIDIIDGKCVRLTQGDYTQKTIYNEDPLEVALEFENNGITRLHLVDLDGAKEGRIVNYAVLKKIATKTNLIIDFGGGIKTEADIETVYDCGAEMATLGSIAVKNPELFYSWIKKYGSEKIFLGADVRDEKITVGGWLENTSVSVFDFIKENSLHGITQLFCTDVSKDGKLDGPSIELYKRIIQQNPLIALVASGGVSCVNDLINLRDIGCAGAIVGKAIYEGKISLEDIIRFNAKNN